jgi:hypothetical protein
MLRIKHPEFQEGIQEENAKVPCSGQANWPWDGHYKSILFPADEEIMGSL